MKGRTGGEARIANESGSGLGAGGGNIALDLRTQGLEGRKFLFPAQ